MDIPLADGPPPALTATGLTKRYGSIEAVRDVDLAIPPGSVTALVGPNGAGKSTLIRTWIGFERPTSGSVSVGGLDPQRRRSAVIGRLGYVPQGASLYRDLTVADHLDLAVTLRRGFDRDGAAARLDRLDIPRRARAGELSGGQQAQVGLALALGTRAAILLLDEPLASLDPLARREFLAVLLEAVRSTGATALLSSHIVTDVEQACDRLIVLGGGQVRLHEGLASARAAHLVGRVGSVQDPPALPAGTRPVAVFPAEDGTPRLLVRLERGLGGPGGFAPDPGSGTPDGFAPDPGSGTPDGFAPASLEEVVLGYLAAGRPGTATEGWAA